MAINEVLHIVSSSLLMPAMAILVLLLAFVIFSTGSIIVEACTERRAFNINVSREMNAIHDAEFSQILNIVSSFDLLPDQKEALCTIVHNMDLPDEDLYSLAKSELMRADSNRRKSIRRSDLVTKIGPMMGLICTLIPLGPGIVAMGQGNVEILSESMLIAFDGTVTGLVVAVVAMVISSIRKRWYIQYSVTMESLASAILEKAEEVRLTGVALSCENISKEQSSLTNQDTRYNSQTARGEN